MPQLTAIELLDYIDPSQVDYQNWVNVGMALKDAGFTAADWDNWSRRDAGRYHAGECFRKWGGFHGSATPVTTATLVAMAKDQGWSPEKSDPGFELAWDAIIGGKDDLVIVDRNWVEGEEVVEPVDWNPVEQLTRYLEILFEASENVGYVCDSWEKDGKHLPTKGAWDRTAGELIQQLNQCSGDIGSVLGDYKEEVGAWIRFNPLDGNGVKDINVTDYRYALVESDAMDIDQQNAIIRELELPVACLVHSGKKSLHAIVKVEAGSYEEYRKRVDYLYNVCRKNGLKIDNQNRNPSRLSRMPGVMRAGHKQFLADTNIGKESWTEWQAWIESVNDDLPEPESMATAWDNLPELSPPLVEGMLRQGHKMLLAGPSKAGKSYALIQLAVAIAEGRRWFDWQCAQGKIMYVNLELDRASCLHRFKDVYQALGWDANNLSNIDVWNLRGKSVPMDKLAPKLIRRAAKKHYIAIIIDPIYKVVTGDENSADQMAKFCNQFDLVCTELGAAVIYCHHHSKGQQGQKRSMDRASGSGVFARDPDALLDLIELDLTKELLAQQENIAVCGVCQSWLDRHVKDWDKDVSQDDMSSEKALLPICDRLLGAKLYKDMLVDVLAARQAIQQRSAWRIDGTLREFPKFKPIDIWFDYPIHHVDQVGLLKDQESEGDKPPWQKGTENRKTKAEKARIKKFQELENAISFANAGEPPSIDDIRDYLGRDKISERSLRDRIKDHGEYEIKNRKILKKEDTDEGV